MMNLKSILLPTFIGTIVYFLLGWLFYGTLFPDLYPTNQGFSMIFIAMGCLFYVLIFSIIYSKLAGIKTFSRGAKTGIVLWLLYAISMNFFMASSDGILNIEYVVTDVLIAAVTTALMGGVVGLTLKKFG